MESITIQSQEWTDTMHKREQRIKQRSTDRGQVVLKQRLTHITESQTETRTSYRLQSLLRLDTIVRGDIEKLSIVHGISYENQLKQAKSQKNIRVTQIIGNQRPAK